MPEQSAEEILDVNVRYHDLASQSYDSKWGISFGEIGHQQVLGKITKLLGPHPGPYEDALEIGAGTGYFTLNPGQSRVVVVQFTPSLRSTATAQLVITSSDPNKQRVTVNITGTGR